MVSIRQKKKANCNRVKLWFEIETWFLKLKVNKCKLYIKFLLLFQKKKKKKWKNVSKNPRVSQKHSKSNRRLYRRYHKEPVANGTLTRPLREIEGEGNTSFPTDRQFPGHRSWLPSSRSTIQNHSRTTPGFLLSRPLAENPIPKLVDRATWTVASWSKGEAHLLYLGMLRRRFDGRSQKLALGLVSAVACAFVLRNSPQRIGANSRAGIRLEGLARSKRPATADRP